MKCLTMGLLVLIGMLMTHDAKSADENISFDVPETNAVTVVGVKWDKSNVQLDFEQNQIIVNRYAILSDGSVREFSDIGDPHQRQTQIVITPAMLVSNGCSVANLTAFRNALKETIKTQTQK